jgi:hypothetical protein
MHPQREFSGTRLEIAPEEQAAEARLEFWKTVRQLRAAIRLSRDLHKEFRMVREAAHMQSLLSEYQRKRREHERRIQGLRERSCTQKRACIASTSFEPPV